MSIFRRLIDFVNPPKSIATVDGFEIPFGLDTREWEALKAWREAPEWETWLKMLDTAASLNAEALLSASGDESLHFHRGVIVGLRRAAFLVDELKQSEAIFLKDKETRASRHTERPGRTSALYGSPAWSKRNR